MRPNGRAHRCDGKDKSALGLTPDGDVTRLYPWETTLTEQSMQQRFLKMPGPGVRNFVSGVTSVFLSSQNLLFCPNILGCNGMDYCGITRLSAY
jgi:hypothetical protein